MSDSNIPTITLPNELIEKLNKRAKSSGFDSLSDYVVYILRQVLSNIEMQETTGKKKVFSKKEKREINQTLRKLGYKDD